MSNPAVVRDYVDEDSGRRVVVVKASTIAAAQLQVTLDKRLGRTTPKVIEKIADAG